MSIALVVSIHVVFHHMQCNLTQSVASLTADPGVVNSIRARSHTFVEIDQEIISMVILRFTLIQERLLSV